MITNLKKFESFQSNDEIHQICNSYNINNYIINSDGSIDVNGHVNLSEIWLEKLPIKFNKVSGNFDCFGNQLTTLEGAPKSVGGDFECSRNRLTTLEGAPQSVDGAFSCRSCRLTTLKGSPLSVGGHFNCYNNNKLTTLEGAPQSVHGNFICEYNFNLTTLKGGPQYVGGYFNCYYNEQLRSLKYLPKFIGGDEVLFDGTAVYEIFRLLGNDSLAMIRYVNELEIVKDDKINIERLNDLLYDEGKPSVENVKGYSNIIEF